MSLRPGEKHSGANCADGDKCTVSNGVNFGEFHKKFAMTAPMAALLVFLVQTAGRNLEGWFGDVLTTFLQSYILAKVFLHATTA